MSSLRLLASGRAPIPAGLAEHDAQELIIRPRKVKAAVIAPFPNDSLGEIGCACVVPQYPKQHADCTIVRSPASQAVS
jgi:hypothetical protein